jgi:hypothetical protein
MLCRLALTLSLGAVCACDAPPPGPEPVAARAPEKAVPVPPSKQRAGELSEQCGKQSREQFRRAWQDGKENAADGKLGAEFTSHYNGKLNTCFYLLTVASANSLKKMLFDINGGELYGEYLGPAQAESPASGQPKICRVESFYCASAREWDVLVAPYMGKE